MHRRTFMKSLAALAGLLGVGASWSPRGSEAEAPLTATDIAARQNERDKRIAERLNEKAEQTDALHQSSEWSTKCEICGTLFYVTSRDPVFLSNSSERACKINKSGHLYYQDTHTFHWTCPSCRNPIGPRTITLDK